MNRVISLREIKRRMRKDEERMMNVRIILILIGLFLGWLLFEFIMKGYWITQTCMLP